MSSKTLEDSRFVSRARFIKDGGVSHDPLVFMTLWKGLRNFGVEAGGNLPAFGNVGIFQKGERERKPMKTQ